MKFGDRLLSLAGVGSGGVDDLVIHAAQFLAPFLVEFLGTSLDRKILLPTHEHHGRVGIGFLGLLLGSHRGS